MARHRSALLMEALPVVPPPPAELPPDAPWRVLWAVALGHSIPSLARRLGLPESRVRTLAWMGRAEVMRMEIAQ